MASLPFRILGINHVGLAPKAPEQTATLFNLLGLANLGQETVQSQEVDTIMYASSVTKPKEASRLEILVPLKEGEGPIGKFLTTRGSGVHHVALMVDNVDAAIKYLTEKGVDLIDKVARPGAHNTRIAFIHPRAAGGLLIELVQEASTN